MKGKRLTRTLFGIGGILIALAALKILPPLGFTAGLLFLVAAVNTPAYAQKLYRKSGGYQGYKVEPSVSVRKNLPKGFVSRYRLQKNVAHPEDAGEQISFPAFSLKRRLAFLTPLPVLLIVSTLLFPSSPLTESGMAWAVALLILNLAAWVLCGAFFLARRHLIAGEFALTVKTDCFP